MVDLASLLFGFRAGGAGAALRGGGGAGRAGLPLPAVRLRPPGAAGRPEVRGNPLSRAPFSCCFGSALLMNLVDRSSVQLVILIPCGNLVSSLRSQDEVPVGRVRLRRVHARRRRGPARVPQLVRAGSTLCRSKRNSGSSSDRQHQRESVHIRNLSIAGFQSSILRSAKSCGCCTPENISFVSPPISPPPRPPLQRLRGVGGHHRPQAVGVSGATRGRVRESGQRQVRGVGGEPAQDAQAGEPAGSPRAQQGHRERRASGPAPQRNGGACARHAAPSTLACTAGACPSPDWSASSQSSPHPAGLQQLAGCRWVNDDLKKTILRAVRSVKECPFAIESVRNPRSRLSSLSLTLRRLR